MTKLTPMFPLTILPLPGELVPLHIFEPRYRELLHDAETDDIAFGIFFNHAINKQRIGALVKLERVIRRYAGGEADIVVKCYDVFTLEKLYRSYKSKKYGAGDITSWNVRPHEAITQKLRGVFEEFQLAEHTRLSEPVSRFDVAVVLNLNPSDRYDFLTAQADSLEHFLIQRIRYQLQLHEQLARSQGIFHLN